MTRFLKTACFLALSSVFSACTTPVEEDQQVVQASVQASALASDVPSSFADTGTGLDKYWYQGKGELNVYKLQQNRYQGIHPGQALLIFVTEDFLVEEQVKNDSYRQPEENSVSILKTNAITRFTTGLYDYSIMTSVFTPVDTKEQGRTLKVTQSVQDWCGQVYSQVNTRNDQYRQQLHSYFEAEADRERTAAANFLEDELLNRIRMDYRGLPTGDELSVVPSLGFLRLKHQEFGAYPASARLEEYTGGEFSGQALQAYTLEYPDLKRTLTVVFSGHSPFYIEGWKETYPSAFDGVERSTIAIREKTILDDYWSKNSNSPEHAALRAELGW